MSDTPNTTESAPQAPNLRSLFLYKIIKGHKVKWEIKVDDQMVIVEEGPASALQFNTIMLPQASAAENVAKEAAKMHLGSHIDRYKSILDSRGIKYVVNENGQIIVNTVPAAEKNTMQFFDLSSPAPDGEGFAALREKYKNEIEEAGGLKGCTACKMNSIQRKYRELLKDIIK
jgi:hypothetical protein